MNNTVSQNNNIKDNDKKRILRIGLYSLLIFIALIAIGFSIYFLIKFIRHVNNKKDDDNDTKDENKTNTKTTNTKKDLDLSYNNTLNRNKEVYLIDSSQFPYSEAEAVCKAFGGELATYEQLVEAYKQGANWCKYGWVKSEDPYNPRAYYPIQMDYYLYIQNNPGCNKKGKCGLPGINGGQFDKDAKFAVTCYGIKRQPTDVEIKKQSDLCGNDMELDNKIRMYKTKLANVMFAPFAEKIYDNDDMKWSMYD